MIPIKYVLGFAIVVMIPSMQSSALANDKDEQRYIENNRQKATEGTEQALFKVYRITCLKSNGGKKALQACQQALAIDPNDAAIRERKKTLTQALKPPPKPDPKPQVVRPTPPPPSIPAPVVRQQPLVEVSNPNVIVEKDKVKETPPKKSQKKVESNQKIVKQVQRQLTQLGFSIGVADGVAGKKTQQAIKRFQKLTNRPLNSKVTPSLLATLKKARIQHKTANKLHVLATEQQKEGRLDTSLKTVAKGLKKAPWHQPLKKLKIAVKQQVVALQKKESEPKNAENEVALEFKDKSKSKEKTEEKKEAIVTVQEKQPEVKKVVLEEKKPPVATVTAVVLSVDQLEKQKELLASIEEKQKNIATINMNISMEQVVLLNAAQQSLEKLERDKSKP